MKKNASERAPAFLFFPGDWLNDPGLRMCSYETKGVWIDLLCIMFMSNEPGVLKIGDEVLDAKGVQKLAKIAPKKFKKVWDELQKFGVLKCDENGRFYSKRMVNEEALRQVRREVGRLGGNPNLKKGHANLVNQNTNQSGNQNPTLSHSHSFSHSNKENNSVILPIGEVEEKCVGVTVLHPVLVHIQKNLVQVSKLTKPLTNEEAQKLVEEFGQAQVLEVLEAMDNFKPLLKKYVSAYQTTKNWLNLRHGKQQQQNGIGSQGKGAKPNWDNEISKF